MPKTEIKFLFSVCHWWEFIAYGEIKPIPVSSKYLSRKQPLSSSQSSFPSSQECGRRPCFGTITCNEAWNFGAKASPGVTGNKDTA